MVTGVQTCAFRSLGGWLNDAKDPTGLQGLVRNGLILTGLLPKNSGHHLIKRVIGVAGDHITADGTSALSVNGVPLDETYVRQGSAPSSVPFDVVVPEGYGHCRGLCLPRAAHATFLAQEQVAGQRLQVSVLDLQHFLGGLLTAGAAVGHAGAILARSLSFCSSS